MPKLLAAELKLGECNIRQFVYRRDGGARLVMERSSMRLVNRDVRAAIRTSREIQMKSSRFPLNFWMCI